MDHEYMEATRGRIEERLALEPGDPYYERLAAMAELLLYYPRPSDVETYARELEARLDLRGRSATERDASLYSTKTWSHEAAAEINTLLSQNFPDQHERNERWSNFVAALTPPRNALFERWDIEEIVSGQLSEAHALLSAVTAQATKVAEDLETAELAASRAETAAGNVGAQALERAFEVYAKGNARAATIYRTAVILLLLSITGVAAASFMQPLPDGGSLVAAISRVSLVAALGALAAYLGRQAGHHRRRNEWAKAISVQLRTFLAFVSELKGEPKDRVYEAFAKRVLGEPPESRQSSDATSIPLQAVVDLVGRLPR